MGYVSAGLISLAKLFIGSLLPQELGLNVLRAASLPLHFAHMHYLGSSDLPRPQGHTYFTDTYL